MAIHMVTRVGGKDFKVTLSRDDAGNYVAEAAELAASGAAGRAVPSVRVVDPVKERALPSLMDSLQRLTAGREPGSPTPDAPAAA